MLQNAGFEDIQITVKENGRDIVKDWIPGSGAENYVTSAYVTAAKPRQAHGFRDGVFYVRLGGVLRAVVGGGGVLPAAGAAGRRRARGARCDRLLPAGGRVGEAGRVRLGAAASRVLLPHRTRAADRDRPRDPLSAPSMGLGGESLLLVGVCACAVLPRLINELHLYLHVHPRLM